MSLTTRVKLTPVATHVSHSRTHALTHKSALLRAKTCVRLHIFVGTWHVLRQSCPFACSRTRLPKMSHWIFNMCTNLMMAGTQSMALIIQASTAESSRPPLGLWLLPQNLLTSILPSAPPPSSLHLCSPRKLPLVTLCSIVLAGNLRQSPSALPPPSP